MSALSNVELCIPGLLVALSTPHKADAAIAAIIGVWSAHEEARAIIADAQARTYTTADDEVEAMFPSFPTCDDMDALNPLRDDEPIIRDCGSLTDEQLLQIYDMWVCGQGRVPLRPVDPSRSSDIVLSAMITLVRHAVVDRDEYGLQLAHILQDRIEQLSNAERTTSSASIDLFREPVRGESARLEPILTELLTLVASIMQLDECRAHPALVSVARVAARVATTALDAPLMKLTRSRKLPPNTHMMDIANHRVLCVSVRICLHGCVYIDVFAWACVFTYMCMHGGRVRALMGQVSCCSKQF